MPSRPMPPATHEASAARIISKRVRYLRLAMPIALVLSLNGHAAQAADVILISHGSNGDSFWNVVKHGMQDAAQDFGIKADYRNPPQGDIAEMARLIDQAAKESPIGVVSTLADYTQLAPALKHLSDDKIALVTINSGSQAQSEAVGAILHVGQIEYQAGRRAGLKAKLQGVKTFLCINHYASNAESHKRCAGFADALGVDPKQSELEVVGDDAQTEQAILTRLESSMPQAILTLGPTSAHPAIRVLNRLPAAKRPYMATFDLSKEISQGIKDGLVQFAIDQQPYLQGYLSVALLALHDKYKHDSVRELKLRLYMESALLKRAARYNLELLPMDPRHIQSGPGLVTRSALASIERYSGVYR